ncbi:unnamed protein product [Meloidogyne enterolobii]|uniref:Uncharacterized protein n=2 Tax=Meloidogyne enterolobii TaxID=390850 RepID=A0A6V7UNT3_MELEN|nr:unnamed protein product [Meloidogyne enterolobii]
MTEEDMATLMGGAAGGVLGAMIPNVNAYTSPLFGFIGAFLSRRAYWKYKESDPATRRRKLICWNLIIIFGPIPASPCITFILS